MPISIRETAVNTAGEQDAVRIRIADAEPGDPKLSFEIAILARVRPLRTPTVAHVQRQTMRLVQETLSRLLQETAKELQEAGYGIEPAFKNPL